MSELACAKERLCHFIIKNDDTVHKEYLELEYTKSACPENSHPINVQDFLSHQLNKEDC